MRKRSILFDPDWISYRQLLEFFFQIDAIEEQAGLRIVITLVSHGTHLEPILDAKRTQVTAIFWSDPSICA